MTESSSDAANYSDFGDDFDYTMSTAPLAQEQPQPDNDNDDEKELTLDAPTNAKEGDSQTYFDELRPPSDDGDAVTSDDGSAAPEATLSELDDFVTIFKKARRCKDPAVISQFRRYGHKACTNTIAQIADAKRLIIDADSLQEDRVYLEWRCTDTKAAVTQSQKTMRRQQSSANSAKSHVVGFKKEEQEAAARVVTRQMMYNGLVQAAQDREDKLNGLGRQKQQTLKRLKRLQITMDELQAFHDSEQKTADEAKEQLRLVTNQQVHWEASLAHAQQQYDVAHQLLTQSQQRHKRLLLYWLLTKIGSRLRSQFKRIK